ncbi:CHAP domain-containing protein [Kitasatospora sp. NPDC127111]|uniref:CHAP domain-containing protein n=1 Tax=Kitasatospora sp. NPDC127111 TaxID=3345363 RepID=UPI00362C5A76
MTNHTTRRTGLLLAATLATAIGLSTVGAPSAGARGTDAHSSATPSSASNSSGADRSAASALREKVVETARDQVGVAEKSADCDKYLPEKGQKCATTPWCAAFVEWVWRHAGVRSVPGDLTGRGVGAWGQEHRLWQPVKGAHPQPGDLLVYGAPRAATPGGHVAVVVAVNGDGTVDTVDGNIHDRVTRRHIDPDTATSGSDGLKVSGYVSVPGA